MCCAICLDLKANKMTPLEVARALLEVDLGAHETELAEVLDAKGEDFNNDLIEAFFEIGEEK